MFRYNGKWTLNYLSRDKVMWFAAVKAFYSLEFVLLLKIHFCFSLTSPERKNILGVETKIFDNSLS